MSTRILIFLVISLIALLGYSVLNFWTTSVAEEAISQAPSVTDTFAAQQQSAACERATAHYDQLLENEPANGNYELRDNKLDAALAQIDRACGTQ